MLCPRGVKGEPHINIQSDPKEMADISILRTDSNRAFSRPALHGRSSTQLLHQNLADELRVGGAFAELHDLALEGVDGVQLAGLEVGDALRVGGDGLVAEGFQRADVADLRRGRVPSPAATGDLLSAIILREDFLGLLAVDLAGGGELGQLGEKLGRDVRQRFVAASPWRGNR